MKTLDEVIKAFEICIGSYCSNAEHDVCPYFGESDMGCMKKPEKDALQYLKEYKGLLKMWNDKLDKEQANPPLTWDELKQMFHRPVWIETTAKKGWNIIVSIDSADMQVIHTAHRGPKLSGFNKADLGTTWQAYRKERE